MTISGLELITAEDAAWDRARAAWNLLADQRPAAIVEARDADDVVHAVRYAAEHGLRVVAQGTGHGAGHAAPMDGALLIRTTKMNGVEIDSTARTARVGAGAQWGDVIAAAAPHGLTGLHGFSSGVGVAGYVLGGGIGWLARSHGLASDHVRAFEVVSPDGERQRIDSGDRFWQLRGGGYTAGVVVTEIELELVPLKEAYAGALLWPMDRANEITHAYREWIAKVPETLTSSLRLLHFPPIPELPVELRGRALVQITLAYTGTQGAALVAPLRALAPEIDRVGLVPARQLGEIAGDPVDPTPDCSRSRLVDVLTPEVVDRVIALAVPGVTVVEIRHLGGALNRPVNPGPLGAIHAEALLFASGVPATPELGLLLDCTFSALDTIGSETLPTFGGGCGSHNTSGR